MQPGQKRRLTNESALRKTRTPLAKIVKAKTPPEKKIPQRSLILIIDTEEMAENHLPAESTYKLDRLVRKLRIHVHGDSHAERCCRRTWELYRRMDKSELFNDV